jgi:hypothetical protein
MTKTCVPARAQTEDPPRGQPALPHPGNHWRGPLRPQSGASPMGAHKKACDEAAGCSQKKPHEPRHRRLKHEELRRHGLTVLEGEDDGHQSDNDDNHEPQLASRRRLLLCHACVPL